MKKYEECQDDELIRRLRDGDDSVMDYLMEKYKDLVRRKARLMYLPGADQEDLIQEGMIGLFKAVRDYEKDRDASFSTFADLCISRQIYTAVEAGARKKHAPLNHYVSLSQPEDRDEDKQAYEPEDVWEKSPEELVIDQENTRLLEETIEQELTPLEKQVMDLHLTGMGYREILSHYYTGVSISTSSSSGGGFFGWLHSSAAAESCAGRWIKRRSRKRKCCARPKERNKYI